MGARSERHPVLLGPGRHDNNDLSPSHLPLRRAPPPRLRRKEGDAFEQKSRRHLSSAVHPTSHHGGRGQLQEWKEEVWRNALPRVPYYRRAGQGARFFS